MVKVKALKRMGKTQEGDTFNVSKVDAVILERLKFAERVVTEEDEVNSRQLTAEAPKKTVPKKKSSKKSKTPGPKNTYRRRDMRAE